MQSNVVKPSPWVLWFWRITKSGILKLWILYFKYYFIDPIMFNSTPVPVSSCPTYSESSNFCNQLLMYEKSPIVIFSTNALDCTLITSSIIARFFLIYLHYLHHKCIAQDYVLFIFLNFWIESSNFLKIHLIF